MTHSFLHQSDNQIIIIIIERFTMLVHVVK